MPGPNDMKRLSGAIPEHIAQRVTALRALDAVLQDVLPPDCAAHCRCAGIAGDTLHLVADSPAWRARLHFYSDRIIKQISRLRKSPVTRISIRVGAPRAERKTGERPEPKRRIPVDAAAGLASLAAKTEDEALRAVLERLSTRRHPG